MIYCSTNPHRACEIWQYILVINTAASSFIWENVYNYDITFRQLMQFNPGRSWAITYTHMWNLSMRTPLPNKTNGNSFGGFSMGNSTGRNTPGKGGAQQLKKRKSDYCWSFNKGQKCKFGSKCKFLERCSYCDSSAHGVVNCTKLEKKSGADSTKAPLKG